MLSNIHRNIMGTTSFDGLFPGMRKAQDFIVYPMHAGNDASTAKIQSDNRIGRIELATGKVFIAKAKGMYSQMFAQYVYTLSGEELFMLKAEIFSSAHGKAGTNGVVYTDNSAALEVFGSAK